MIPRSLPDIHVGEVGSLPEPADDDDLDEELEDGPASDDLIEILGFDPDAASEEDEP